MTKASNANLIAPSISPAVLDVLAERLNQVRKGYTPAHDDAHTNGEIANFAAVYAMDNENRGYVCNITAKGGECGYTATVEAALNPHAWSIGWNSRRRDLVIASALLIAEIERLDRAAVKAEPLTGGQLVGGGSACGGVGISPAVYSRNDKINFVQQQMDAGAPSYYGLTIHQICLLADDRLEVEFDCAQNWAEAVNGGAAIDDQRKRIDRVSFEAVTRPVIRWLNDHMHPHASIIIDTQKAEAVSGEIVFTTDDYIRD